jgi:hypothetical protein
MPDRAARCADTSRAARLPLPKVDDQRSCSPSTSGLEPAQQIISFSFHRPAAALPMSPFVLVVAVLTRTPAVFVAVAVRCFHPKKTTKGLALWTRADSANQSSSVSTYQLPQSLLPLLLYRHGCRFVAGGTVLGMSHCSAMSVEGDKPVFFVLLL